MATEYKLSYTAAEIDERLGMVSQVSNEIGNLANLETTDKSNLVAAINEAAKSSENAVELDTTLTVEGAAADAKAVGDAIQELRKTVEANHKETVNETGVMVSINADEGAKIKVEGDTTEAVNLYHAGRNLAPSYTGEDITKNGTTVTKAANGKVTVSGTPTADTYINIYKKADPYYLPAGTYTMIPYGFPDAVPGGSTGLVYMLQSVDSTITKTVSTDGVARFTLATGTYFMVALCVYTVYAGDSHTIGVLMVNEDVEQQNAVNYEYEPYLGGRISTALPASVEAFDGINTLYAEGGHVLNASISGGNIDYVLPVGGDELGGVKNGGNVIINPDGTMTALTSDSGGGGGVVAEGSGAMVELELKEGHTIEVSGETTETVNLYHAGRNLMPTYTGNDTTKSGASIKKNTDGTVTISGTPTANAYFDIYKKTDPFYLPAGTYTMIPYGFPTVIGLSWMLNSVDGSIVKTVSTGGVARFTLEEGMYFAVTISVFSSYSGDGHTIGVLMVNEDVDQPNAVNYEYEPYKGGRISTTLPTSIKAFGGTNIVYADGADTLDVTVKENLTDIVDERIKQVTAFDYVPYGLPVLYLTGDTSTMTKDDSVDLSYVYGELSGTASVKWQGSSAIQYPKKNYTVKFDTAFEAVEGWGEQKKYCMKANFIDFSHARNVCGAKLWGQIVASRNPANETLAACPNYGAVDGFPICMVINDEFHGVYTFNVPKDAWMANMGNGTQEAILCADLNSEADAFKAEAVVGGNYTDFELEYVTDENNASWVQTSLNNLIRACINSDGSDLDTTIAEMLDWDSAIDYYIFCALTDNYDGIVKNYLLFTYDGVKWLFDAYDLDSIFGGHPDGKLWRKADIGMTITHLKGRHRVFELIFNHKKDALKARYAELRNSVLSEDNVQYVVRNFAANIPRQMLEEDSRKWPTIPSTNISNTQQILDWYRLRVARIDKEIESI